MNGERVLQVEDADFTPMILSSSGGMGAEMSMALKHLGEKVAEKCNLVYSKVAGYLRAMFSFEMMRLALIRLRGSRSRFKTCVGKLIRLEIFCCVLNLLHKTLTNTGLWILLEIF